MTVYDPSGNPVLDTATAAGIDPLLNLGVTGTYVVQVHDEAGTTNTGTYSLAANWLLPSGKRCGVSPVGCDNTVAAAIGSAGASPAPPVPGQGGRQPPALVCEDGRRVRIRAPHPGVRPVW